LGIDRIRVYLYRGQLSVVQERGFRVRVPLDATLSKRPYKVLNISIRGALGVFSTRLPNDSIHLFRLGADGDALDINARVMRSCEVDCGWETAIEFIQGSSPHGIGALIARLVRDVRRP
jgi:hypothetical protein